MLAIIVGMIRRADAVATVWELGEMTRGTRKGEGLDAPKRRAWCDAERPELSAGTVAVAFRDYHLAHGSTMKSWPAAWRTWVRKERAPIRVAPAYGKTALDKQADVIAKILRIDTAQPLDIFDEQPRLSAARD